LKKLGGAKYYYFLLFTKMEDLMQDLGSNISLLQHVSPNTWQEFSEGEDDDQMEWIKKETSQTSLSVQDSMGRPNFVSWASEMSMYDGHSNPRPSMSGNMGNKRYNMNSRECESGQKRQVVCTVNAQQKIGFNHGSNKLDSNYKKFLQVHHESSCRSREEHVRAEPQSEYPEKVFDKFVTVKTPRPNEKPLLSNFPSTERSISSSNSIPVFQELSREEHPAKDAILSDERNGHSQVPSAQEQTVSPVSTNRSEQHILALKGFQGSDHSDGLIRQSLDNISENHQSEQSTEWLSQNEILNLQAEPPWAGCGEDIGFLEYDQQIQALNEENARLKEKIVQIRERSHNVEVSLKEENNQLLRELMNLKQSLKVEQSLNAHYREKARELGQLAPNLPNVPQTISPNQSLQKPQSQAANVLQENTITHSKIDSPGSITSLAENKSSEESSSHVSPIRDDEKFFQTNDESKEVNINSKFDEEKGFDVESFKKQPTRKKSEKPTINLSTESAKTKSSGSNTDAAKNATRRKSGKKESGKKEVKAPIFDYTNLIVNYLPPDMDCGLLQKVFSNYGDIVGCKVVMDHKTGLSKGYGFVKFKTKEEADRAVQGLDQWQIGGKVLRVACARKPERGKSDGRQTNLYIANLDKHIETHDIERVFSKCGYVVQCRVLKDVRGVTRRIGFVRFDTHENAMRAIKCFDGKKMEGSKSVIQVRFANIPKPPPTVPRAATLQTNLSPQQFPGQPSPLLIAGEQLATGIPFLPNSVRSVGALSGTLLPPSSQLSHYTNISSHSEHGALSRNTGLLVDDFQTDPQTPMSAACYVSGISATTDEAEIKGVFDPDGLNIIKSVRVIRRRVGPYAFVNFFKIEDARQAVNTLNQTQMGTRTLTVRLR